ncbi:MAG: translocation/assembly module TamB domain-containing protein [Bdellovibrionota bacterium]
MSANAKTWTKRILKTIAVTLGAVVLFVVLFVTAFFATPEFHLPTGQLAGLIDRYAPEELDVRFTQLEIALQRPKGHWLAKRVVIDAAHLCVQYHGEAVIACLDEFHVATTLSSSGIDSIEPIKITGINANVDLPKFPKSEKKDEAGGFDMLGFLRKHVIPKWDIDDSRVEIRRFVIKTAPGEGYTASLDLGGGVVPGRTDVVLHDLQSLSGPLYANAKLRIVRPASWGRARAVKAESNQWKVGLEGRVSLDRTRKLVIKGDANILTFKELDTRVQVFLSGVTPLREGRVEAKLKGDDASGALSLKLGATGAQMRALDFVNCDWKADLEDRTGSVHCGPNTVRLVVKEQSFLKRPDLFTFRPRFDLNVKRVSFGEEKGADVDIDLRLDHREIVTFATKLEASFSKKGESAARYAVKGNAELALPEFSHFTTLVKRTPYSIPAPLNTLTGKITLKTDVDFTQDGGAIDYKFATLLDSAHQALHMHLNGKTFLTPRGPKRSLHPATDATLVVDRVRLSAPRFDLRAPPALKPDSRFGPINEPATIAKKEAASPPMDFKLRIMTGTHEAAKIATNLTKSAIPLSFDVVYDGSVRDSEVEEVLSVESASSFRRDVAALAKKELDRSAMQKKSPVTGWVIVGRTPVDLFKRNAVLEEMRVDLLETGDNRVNGRVSVSYLEYTIQMMVMGAMREPQVRFFSDPPLDDDQIVSVLLFGRPAHELGEDEKASVASLNAAFTNAALSVSSLYLLASTPVESVGYDPEKQRVTARVGLGGGASLELGGGGAQQGSGVGIRKRLSSDFIFRSDVETLGTTGKKTISALIEWVKKF